MTQTMKDTGGRVGEGISAIPSTAFRLPRLRLRFAGISKVLLQFTSSLEQLVGNRWNFGLPFPAISLDY